MGNATLGRSNTVHILRANTTRTLCGANNGNRTRSGVHHTNNAATCKRCMQIAAQATPIPHIVRVAPGSTPSWVQDID